MSVTASTPGRICLFGEHQDYLGMPIIAAAISCRIQLTARATSAPYVQLHLPDLGTEVCFALTTAPLAYQRQRDYFRSALNVLWQEGFRFSGGIEGQVRGNIPINAGTSSSSALLVTWLHVLTQLAAKPQTLSPQRLAELAYRAEVLEFGEPGGMMDHYATAVGQVIYLATSPTPELRPLHPKLGTFVLGNSHQPKDTIGILGRVKGGMRQLVARIQALNPDFSLQHAGQQDVARYRHLLSADEQRLLAGTLDNRDILRQALVLLEADSLDHQQFGKLLTAHHQNLRDAQRISTPKIDRMVEAALEAGALGGKINGSGGGGCMFAYAPDAPEQVAEAIERAGGEAFIVQLAEGTRLEALPTPSPQSSLSVS
nr:galactokinase family protein [Fibrella aestuarina]